MRVSSSGHWCFCRCLRGPMDTREPAGFRKEMTELGFYSYHLPRAGSGCLLEDWALSPTDTCSSEVRSQLHLPVLIVWRRLLSLQNVDVCWGTTRVDLKHVPVFSQFFKQNLAFRAWTYSMPAFCSHFSESVGSWISTFKKDFLSYVAVLFTLKTIAFYTQV